MKLELKALDNKTNWSNVINKHETNYQRLKVKFEKEKETAQRRDIYYEQDLKNEAMLVQAKKNTNILMDAQKELHETEIGVVDTMNTLDEQTAQIKKVKKNLEESNNLLDNMGKTIKKMKRRWWA